MELSTAPFEHLPNAGLSLHTTIITSQLNAENVYHSTHSIDREKERGRGMNAAPHGKNVDYISRGVGRTLLSIGGCSATKHQYKRSEH